MLLKRAKLAVIRAVRNTPVKNLVLNSEWRRNRLGILCFHGISTADEHKCFPGFFITPEDFRRKLQLIRDLALTVLPLDEAINRLGQGTLPRRSVVITLDDGFYGAYAAGRAILDEFGYPTTVYLTSHYIHHDRPVFDNMCNYLLWRSYGTHLEWARVFANPATINAETHPAIYRKIHEYAQSQQLDSLRKDELLRELADRVSIDYEELRRRRILHLVRPDEMRSWRTVEYELHTHRHRVSRQKGLFQDSIRRNRDELKRITGRESQHFAYPGGAFLMEHPGWLREMGIRSAVTCISGLAEPTSDALLLPRLMDTADLRLEELESWLSGYSAFFPTRRYPLDFSQFEESETPVGSNAKPAREGNAG
jgi:peptidoglycan/xylan/chitin deacetylase (PgdA/CDA1 family)